MVCPIKGHVGLAATKEWFGNIEMFQTQDDPTVLIVTVLWRRLPSSMDLSLVFSQVIHLWLS
jgi:hypothetical protein